MINLISILLSVRTLGKTPKQNDMIHNKGPVCHKQTLKAEISLHSLISAFTDHLPSIGINRCKQTV